MIDYGLLISVALGFGVPALVMRRWPLTGYRQPVEFLDAAIGPASAGLVVGRLTALALDDPGSIGSLSDMLIIRSGVEFWPGVVAAAAALSWGAHRAAVPPLGRVAELAPLAMVGYASYESGCVFRDGCFGPQSPIGLRPPGLTATMLPVGWLMALAIVVGAVVVRRLSTRGRRPALAVLTAVLSVALVRAVGSIWLPHIGDGVTRQHASSVGVAATATVGLIALSVALRRPQLSSRSRPDKAGLAGSSEGGECGQEL